MNGGDVELTGAVDFDPNEVENKEQKPVAEEPVATVDDDFPEPIAAEDIVYHAEDIDQKDNNELFVKVEGGERRKREKARKEAAKNKKILREASRKVRHRGGASKEVREAEEKLKREQSKIGAENFRQQSRGRLKKFFGFIWGGWHKWVVIATPLVIASIVLLSIFVIAPLISAHMENAAKDADAKAAEVVPTIREEADNTLINGEGDGNDYDRAKKVFEDKIASGNREEKIYTYLSYAEFIQQYTNDVEDALAKFAEAEKLLKTDREYKDYYAMLDKVYKRSGYLEESENAANKAREYDPEYRSEE